MHCLYSQGSVGIRERIISPENSDGGMFSLTESAAAFPAASPSAIIVRDSLALDAAICENDAPLQATIRFPAHESPGKRHSNGMP